MKERGLVLLLLGMVFLALPMARPGLPPTHDGIIHAYRVVEMARLWQAGVFYPRWAPDLAFGRGYPLFHYNAPLFPWLAAVGVWVGLAPEDAIKLVLIGAAAFGSVGVYGLARWWGLSEGGAAIAGLAYAYAPFRVRELYGQGDFPQYLALSVLPWVLWATGAYIHRGGWSRGGGAGAAYGLLLLSHNITAMLGTPVILGHGLLVIVTKGHPVRGIVRLARSLALGLGLAAFFVVPALMDRPLVHLDRLTQGEYDFRKHFIGLGEIFSMPPLRDDRLGNRREFLTLGLPLVLLAMPALGEIVARHRHRALALGCTVGLAAMIGMMTSASRPLWETVPLLAFAEFPWRWLGLAALPLALLIGLAAEIGMARWPLLIPLGFSWTLILSANGLMHNGGTWIPLRDVGLRDLHRYERDHRYPGLTSVGELFPRWVEGEIESSPLEEAYRREEEPSRLDEASLPPGAWSIPLDRAPLDQRYWVHLPVTAPVRFYTLAFPGWEVLVDGHRIPMWAEARTGWLWAEVPAGAHEITLRFRPLWWWRFLEGFSLGLWGMVIARGGWSLRALRIPSIWIHHPWTLTERGLAVSFLLGALLRLPDQLWSLTRVPLDRPEGPAAYLQVDYQRQIRLLGYRLDPSVVLPGGEARLTLWWRALTPISDQYSVYVHAMPWEDPATLAFQSDHMHPAEIPTNAWDPQRIYRDEHRLRIPLQAHPGVYRLRVGLYHRLEPTRRLQVDETGADGLDLPLAFVVARPVLPLPRPIAFSGKIRLLGVETPAALPAGQPWTLWLSFEALAPLDADYTLFVHIVDAAGQLRAQRDLYQPTRHWPVGASIPVEVPLPGLSQPGRYMIRVGWYRWPGMEHLLPDPQPEQGLYGILPISLEVGGP